MDIADADLEEGEISDESDCGLDLYTPLERPTEARVPEHQSNMADLSPEELESEDSDSDDGRPCGKRLRMSAPSTQIPKKYRVWAYNANDNIADMLTSFGMETPENDRNVENYPLPKEKLLKDRLKMDARERKRKIPVARLHDPLAPIPVPKELDDVDVNETNTLEEVAKQIAEKLDEPNLPLMQRIVLILGKEMAIEYFRKTREIESKGGLLIMNGSRRRTSGGVFIHLIRTDKQIPGSKLVEIFEDPNILKIQKEQNKCAKSRQRRNRRNRPRIQKQLSNPPPSPEVPSEGDADAAPEVPSLPELPSRKDLLTIRDLRLPDPSRELLSYEGMDFPDFP